MVLGRSRGEEEDFHKGSVLRDFDDNTYYIRDEREFLARLPFRLAYKYTTHYGPQTGFRQGP